MVIRRCGPEQEESRENKPRFYPLIMIRLLRFDRFDGLNIYDETITIQHKQNPTRSLTQSESY